MKSWIITVHVCCMLALAACAPTSRTYEKTVTRSVAAEPTSQLYRAASRLGDPGDGRSGVRLVSDGEQALVIRLLMAAAAEQTIDAQYYLLHDDPTGHLFAASLLRAADRGVRVRLLLDDMDTSGYDAMTAALDLHENIEIRLFNPFWRDQSLLIAGLTDFKRINRRMHNKSMTADNTFTIVGGRNIGAEYFLAREEMNYADLDVLATGPVVRQVSDSFDTYWNSEFAVPAAVVIDEPQGVSLNEARDRLNDLVDEARDTPYGNALRRSAQETFAGNALSVDWVQARLYADPPSKAAGADDPEQILASQLLPYFETAKNEVNIISAYFVPRNKGVAWMSELENRGVDIKVVTNSLASNDVAPVYAHYAKKRRALLRAGVELYELRPDAYQVQQRGINWAQSRSGLHSKAFTIDDRYVFVGSFNWDPRSVNINTEMGILIDSPDLAVRTMGALDEALPAYTYNVTLEEAGKLVWTTRQQDGTVLRYDAEPTGSAWDHIISGVLAILPIGSQL
ncbi:phospholipase D family protein [Ruegeria lacuscaerulensis]|uniref:phospholipase D family protein n=1 Tax=Ruegeria lacuscaerulensis TaxID=55218 RepID=UPI00147B6320|nr:phospholipase D family protein [Ruegeria lacuscaerulensis]